MRFNYFKNKSQLYFLITLAIFGLVAIPQYYNHLTLVDQNEEFLFLIRLYFGDRTFLFVLIWFLFFIHENNIYFSFQSYAFIRSNNALKWLKSIIAKTFNSTSNLTLPLVVIFFLGSFQFLNSFLFQMDSLIKICVNVFMFYLGSFSLLMLLNLLLITFNKIVSYLLVVFLMTSDYVLTLLQLDFSFLSNRMTEYYFTDPILIIIKILISLLVIVICSFMILEGYKEKEFINNEHDK